MFEHASALLLFQVMAVAKETWTATSNYEPIENLKYFKINEDRKCVLS